MGHARLSPSSASRWMQCPGSIRECSGIVEEASPYAAEGTAAHALLEYCLQNSLAPESFIGQTFNDFEVTREMADAVGVAHQYVADLYQSAIDCGGTFQMYPEVNVFPARLERLDVDGTADIVVVTDQMVEVIDYKHGAGVAVSPRGNRQLQIYGIGALDTLGLEGDKPLRTTIIQPRVNQLDGPIHFCTYSPEQVDQFTEEIRVAAAATDDPNAPLVPGEEQCRFCRAKSTCTALADHSLKAAQVVFDDLTVATPAMIEENSLRPVNQLTEEQVCMILDNEALIRNWLTAVTDHAKEEMLKGRSYPGFKLVAGRKSRKWDLKDDSLEELLRSLKKKGS